MLRAFFKFVVGRPRLSGLVFMAAASPAMYFAWDAALASRVRQLRENLRAEGFPVVNADLNRPAIPDEQNAWHYHLQASKIVRESNVDSPRSTNHIFPFDKWKDETWLKMAEASDKAHPKAFELAHEAMKHPTGWTNEVYEPLDEPQTLRNAGHLNQIKNLANAINDNAEYQNARGNPALALERVRDSMHLAQMTGQDPNILSALVSMGITAMGLDTLQQIGPTLMPKDLPQTRQPIRKLIENLLDEPSRTRIYLDASAAERLNGIGLADQLFAVTWFHDPLRKLAEFQTERQMKLAQKALRSADWQSALTSLDRDVAMVPNYLLPLRRMSISSIWIERYYRMLAETRITAIALACHLYRMEHDNQFPKTLGELVPGYLPAVPLDPYTQKPMVYYPNQFKTPDGQSDRPVLVFQFGKDAKPDPVDPQYSWYFNVYGTYATRECWQYRDLIRFAPVVASTGPEEAFDDEPAEPDEAGDQDDPENQPPPEGGD